MIGLAPVLGLSWRSWGRQTPRRPNILLVIADDLGKDACAGYPGYGVDKPNMPTVQALAYEGITYTNFITNPLCSPTRATMLTGRYSCRTGVQLPVSERAPSGGIPRTEVSLQRYITENAPGPRAQAVIGKWHLSDTSNGGNDNPGVMGIPHFHGTIAPLHAGYFRYPQVTDGVESIGRGYNTTTLTTSAISWIGQQDQPWFLWLAYNAPHSPLHEPPPRLHTRQGLRGPAADTRTNPLPFYLAMIEAMDTEIGRLLNSLSQEERENTIVVFLGDNGTPRNVIQEPYSPWQAKGTLYQGGINCPLIVAGKSVARRGDTDGMLLNSTDLFATIAELTGAELPSYEDSRSFAGSFAEPAVPVREHAFAEVAMVDQATARPVRSRAGWSIQNERYKLIRYRDGAEELYDLREDPYEQNGFQAPLSKDVDGEYRRLVAKAAEVMG